ncbi:MAG: DNA polymerase/3'-5' exonuclease PolX [Acidobacteria bacterium]|uniref:DNA polymerase beta n=1 Tax=Candidatus Polarisedimenticola svalbardensis TaxID=2886004 RepID=A0A8J7CDN7_9BACT|nr:DNA polymerase/3'-5' exonuclease PolX [Candidatus Polarisedimenticola svalbardensis]
MNRNEVAAALSEIGTLLELLGENPFKTRAYGNAARLIKSMDQDLPTLVEKGELDSLKGIGKALAEKITLLVRDGRLPYLDELRARVPPGLLDWLRIPGLGPKKVRAIHLALGISTLGELEYACQENRLRDLDGFGQASQDKILPGIDRLRRNAGRFLQPVVQQEADRLLELVRGVPGVIRAEVAGSVRRRSETSKDIDIVVASPDPEPVMEQFAASDQVEEITGRGPTKCSVVLKSGPSADLRVVDELSFPFTVMYFTGSKDHNIAMRSRARAAGLKLNEYGLVPENGGDSLPCADEAAIYSALDLPYIEPELREDLGELEAGSQGELPALVSDSDICGILHCHSTWSDGSASIADMASACRERGYTYLGISDHSQAASYAGGLSPAQVLEQHEEIDRLNADLNGTFTILKGIEVDILADGKLDYPDEIMARFDLVVASVHSRFNLSEQDQTDRILKALDNPFVDILGHPTGRLLLAREPYALDLRTVVRAAAERNVAVEVNAHPSRLDLDWRELAVGLRHGLLTSINPDAHSPAGIDHVRHGVGIARKGWCTPEQALNAWPLPRLQDWLKERRTGR